MHSHYLKAVLEWGLGGIWTGHNVIGKETSAVRGLTKKSVKPLTSLLQVHTTFTTCIHYIISTDINLAVIKTVSRHHTDSLAYIR